MNAAVSKSAKADEEILRLQQWIAEAQRKKETAEKTKAELVMASVL